MGNQWILRAIALFIALFACVSFASTAEAKLSRAAGVKSCLADGWKPLNVRVAGQIRSVLWKRPRAKWKSGAIVVFHGGGGSHHEFCAGGDRVEPQIEFANQAVEEGFAVFLLDSTDSGVSDAKGMQCGKHFDFPVLNRRNVDLHFIGKMVKTIIPQLRPGRSSEKLFLTGLSTGGYMATRAATHFNSKITAFAPVAAGDPYGTRMDCRKGKSQKVSLIDLETNKKLGKKKSCSARHYTNEKKWPHIKSKRKPVFKQFHSKGDAVIDISCVKKAKKQLQQYGYRSKGMLLLGAKRREAANHLWLERYNDAILEFFKEQ